MATHGYKPAGNPTDYGYSDATSNGNQRAYVPDALTQNGYLYAIGGVVGKHGSGTGPDTVFAAWDGVGVDDLLAQTATFVPTNTMLDSISGATYERALSGTALKVKLGQSIAYGYSAVGGPGLAHGMTAAANIPSATNKLFYFRNRSTVAPTDPMGWTSSSNEGHMAVYGLYMPNVPPDVPINRSPGVDALLTTATPTFAGDFRDNNETMPAPFAAVPSPEKLARIHIQIWREDTGAELWDEARNATSTEQTNRRFSWLYDGAALPTGVWLVWHCRVSDQHGAYSDFSSDLRFKIGSGSVTASGNPTLKQTTRTPPSFNGTWNDTGGSNANRVEVRVRSGGPTGTILRAAVGKTINVPPGNALQMTWADTAWAQFNWGDGAGTAPDLYWEMRARRTADSVFSDWSGRTFWIDAAPSTPVIVGPKGNIASTTRPKLVATVTDADDIASALTVKARIMDNVGTVLFTRAMVNVAGTNTFEYQTTSTDLAAFGSFQWDAYSYDGTVYSGGQTVEASAAKSAVGTFQYLAGPTVTLTAPSDGATITTSQPTLTWTTSSTQASRRIIITDTTDSVVALDTGAVSTGVQSYTVPDNILTNTHVYTWQVIIVDTAVLTGTSPLFTMTLSYPEPPQLPVLANPFQYEGDTSPTAVLLSWAQTSYTETEFQYYLVIREIADDNIIDPDTAYEGEQTVTIAKVSEPTVVQFIDDTPASGINYKYRVRQVVVVGRDTLNSKLSESQILLSFEDTIIHDHRAPGDLRVVLPARGERRITRRRRQNFLDPWNQRKSVELRAKTWYREVSGEWPIAGSDLYVKTVLNTLDYMDNASGPYLYRDGRSNRMWVTITEYEEMDPAGGRIRRISATFRQVTGTEGRAEVTIVG